MKDYLLSLRERHLQAVMDLIDDVVDEGPADGSALAEMCHYHMQTGGKRLRAVVPLAVAETLEADPEPVIPFAAACEMLHNATLVHDDLQDGDATRRGEPTIWKKFGLEHAVNLGDAMLYWPLLMLDRLDCSDERFRSINRRFARQALSVIDGQEREFALMHVETPTAEDYFRMVEGKTGGLFRLAVAGGAELSGASAELVEQLDAAAADLGVLFQIQDDILDLYGEKGREHRGTDICEGKISALVVHYLEHADAEEAAQLRDLLKADREEVSLEQIDATAESFRRVGSLDAALREIVERRERALAQPEIEARPPLQQLLDGIAELFVAPIRHVFDDRGIPLDEMND
jgi:geranylgeranyl pyrophosphate synthase